MLSSIERSDFRDKLIRAFPPKPFYGPVSAHNECGEGIDLIRELPGKRWDEISNEFLDFNSGSLPLLEPAALVAFLPAWLLRSMETSGDETVIAEFTMYFLCPGSEDEGWDIQAMTDLVSSFDPAQRRVVEDFLRSIVANKTLEYWHPYAEFGLAWWADDQEKAVP